jgi:ABC-type polysaccharide/polyol phosphate transport system ATPase subunit
VDQVIEMAEMGDLTRVPIAKCPKAAVSRFALAVALCVPFDTYLFTNPVVGDKAARDKFQQKVEEVGATHGLIVATANAKVAQLHCDRAFLIDGRTTHYYDDIEAAAAHLARLTKPARQEDEEDAEFAGEEEERVFDDF